MSASNNPLPLVRRLPSGFSLSDAFARLATLPGCLWLDSASRGPTDKIGGHKLGRYSFLTAQPVRSLTASPEDRDPWPELRRWCETLPTCDEAGLPPFQGGIAGLIGYEAGAWLEPVGLAQQNDLPTPALSLGLYDWTIAVDHQYENAWLISQGFSEDLVPDPQIAADRADWVMSLLESDADDDQVPQRNVQGETTGDVSSNFTSEQFQSSVSEIVRGIHDGDSFQVNLAQRLSCVSSEHPAELYQRLRKANPAPFAGYYSAAIAEQASDDVFAVLSSSPEGFLKVRGRTVETRPIKGTIKRTGNEADDRRLGQVLHESEKDRAENVMIVDLMRNDLSRVCDDHSVQVAQLCEVERYQFVQHLVSVVTGRLATGLNVVDLLAACFPGGSVTGAPKIEAMRTIARLEPHRRGPYCGSLGYISCSGSADFNILIRTITAAHGHLQIPVGGGITARSNPAAEEAETWAKAKGMLKALAPE